jgi:hypothetical protein
MTMVIAALVIAWVFVGGAFILAISEPSYKPLKK